jgi:hypothetical protein
MAGGRAFQAGAILFKAKRRLMPVALGFERSLLSCDKGYLPEVAESESWGQ